MWPSYPTYQQFRFLGGVVCDSSENVYVLDYANARVVRLDSSDNFAYEWCVSGSDPFSMAIFNDQIYLAELNGCRVQVFDTEGTFVRKFGKRGTQPGKMLFPAGIAIDFAGNVYIADSGNDRIGKFTTLGDYLGTWGTSGSGEGQFISPESVAVDSVGDVYVGDQYNDRIQKFAPDGTFIKQWTGFDQISSISVVPNDKVYVGDLYDLKVFNANGRQITTWTDEYLPKAVAANSGGDLYIAGSGALPLKKRSSTGEILKTWGSSWGHDEGYFDYPTGIAIDGEGNVYVADTQNNRIQKFGANGQFIRAWGGQGSGPSQFSFASYIAVDDLGNVYVSDSGNNRIQVFTTDGQFISMFGSAGNAPSSLNFPDGIAVDHDGNILVATGKIKRFTSDGVFIDVWGTSGDNYIYDAVDVAIDGEDNVFVLNRASSRVQKFSGTGELLLSWGARGQSEGQFDLPRGISVDVMGNVYVADSGNHRIQKFNRSGIFRGSIGSCGGTAGKLSSPHRCAIGADGNVYVSDSRNDRVQRFVPEDESPTVIAVSVADANPTNRAAVDFAVEFSEPVLSVSEDDFVLSTAGVSGAQISNILAAAQICTVTVGTGVGDGTIRLDVTDNNSVLDATAHPLGGPEIGDGDYASGEVYTIDKTPPTLEVSASVENWSKKSPIPVRLEFSEPVTDVRPTKIRIENGTLNNFQSFTDFSYFDLVPASRGIVVVNVLSGIAKDLAGNPSLPGPQLVRSYRSKRPTTSMTTSTANPATSQQIKVRVVFSAGVVGFSQTDFVLWNCELTSFEKVDETTYDIKLKPLGWGTVFARVPKNSVATESGFGNQPGLFIIDYTSPTKAAVHVESHARTF